MFLHQSKGKLIFFLLIVTRHGTMHAASMEYNSTSHIWFIWFCFSPPTVRLEEEKGSRESSQMLSILVFFFLKKNFLSCYNYTFTECSNSFHLLGVHDTASVPKTERELFQILTKKRLSIEADSVSDAFCVL